MSPHDLGPEQDSEQHPGPETAPESEPMDPQRKPTREGSDSPAAADHAGGDPREELGPAQLPEWEEALK